PASQVTLIEHLGDRGDAEAAPAIRNAMKSKDDSVRIAAIRALGAVGSERDVLPLARIAAADASPESSAARQSLIRLRNVDSTLVTALPSVPPRVRAEMVHDLAARHYM